MRRFAAASSPDCRACSRRRPGDQEFHAGRGRWRSPRCSAPGDIGAFGQPVFHLLFRHHLIGRSEIGAGVNRSAPRRYGCHAREDCPARYTCCTEPAARRNPPGSWRSRRPYPRGRNRACISERRRSCDADAEIELKRRLVFPEIYRLHDDRFALGLAPAGERPPGRGRSRGRRSPPVARQ